MEKKNTLTDLSKAVAKLRRMFEADVDLSEAERLFIEIICSYSGSHIPNGRGVITSGSDVGVYADPDPSLNQSDLLSKFRQDLRQMPVQHVKPSILIRKNLHAFCFGCGEKVADTTDEALWTVWTRGMKYCLTCAKREGIGPDDY